MTGTRPLELILYTLVWVVVVIGPILAIAYVIYYWFSWPLRRASRARLFMDILETGVQKGLTLEQSILSTRPDLDRSFGRKFRFFWKLLRSGVSFPQALESTPGLLPLSVQATLRASARVSCQPELIRLARGQLRHAAQDSTAAIHYLVALCFVITPVVPAVSGLLLVFVYPKFEEIFQGMTDGAAVAPFLFGFGRTMLIIQIVIVLTLYAAAVLYVLAPRIRRAMRNSAAALWLDQLAYRVPWKRLKLTETMVGSLGVLLDCGIPEDRALELAGDCTGNEFIRRRSTQAAAHLRGGVALPEAARSLDDSGEFAWRLRVAAAGPKQFVGALAGWRESLDAKAFQQEQTVAQVFTTSLVLLNGLMVGFFAASVFGALISIIKAGTLW